MKSQERISREEEVQLVRQMEMARICMAEAVIDSPAADEALSYIWEQLRLGQLNAHTVVRDALKDRADLEGVDVPEAVTRRLVAIRRLVRDMPAEASGASSLKRRRRQVRKMFNGLGLKTDLLLMMGQRLKVAAMECEEGTPLRGILLGACQRFDRAQHQAIMARDELVSAHMYLVVKVARRYQNMGLSLADLVQEGNIGLLRSVEKFDPNLGYRFATYSFWWIRQAITRSISDKGRTIRFPVYQYSNLREVKRSHHLLARQGGFEPAPEEIAEDSGMDVSTVNAVLELPQEPLSTETPLRDAPDMSIGDSIVDHDAVSPLKAALDRDRARQTRAALGRLSSREQQILSMRFGIGNQSSHTLQEVGQRFHLTRERIRQIEAKALGKLRRRCRKLRPLITD